MRREEILALRWDCIDLEAEAPYLYVQRALRWEHNRPCVSDTLKSPTAKRKLPLPQKLVGHLASLPKDEGFLFGGAQPLSCTQFRHLWKIVSKRLDFHVTSHQLRHTYITRLVLGGVNLKYVQYLAGHSSLNVTLKIYTHILAENIPSMASEINSALCA